MRGVGCAGSPESKQCYETVAILLLAAARCATGRRRQRADPDHRSLRARAVVGARASRDSRHNSTSASGSRPGCWRAARGRPIVSCSSCTAPARQPKWPSTCRYQDYSWMAYLAQAGFDAFSVDMTGYGRSTRPPAMNDPCNLAPNQQAALVPRLLAAPCPRNLWPGHDDNRVRLGRRGRRCRLHPRPARRRARQPGRLVARRSAFGRLCGDAIRRRCIVSCCSRPGTAVRAGPRRLPRFPLRASSSIRSREQNSMRTGIGRSAVRPRYEQAASDSVWSAMLRIRSGWRNLGPWRPSRAADDDVGMERRRRDEDADADVDGGRHSRQAGRTRARARAL